MPAIFLNDYPALYFLGEPGPLGLSPLLSVVSPLVGMRMLGLALTFWGYRLRHHGRGSGYRIAAWWLADASGLA